MNSAPRLRIESALTASPHRARASRWQTAAGLLGVTLVALALAGCASLGGGGARPASLERAETLARRGDAAAAAREYAALAEDNSGVDAQNYQLRAAEQWLAAGQPDQARQAISAIEGNLENSIFDIRLVR